ncbi:hypothetical protein CA839_09470 [Fusobacterium polymorphum]|mgnify:FL=1|uniref:Uncharacterized protein n=1 Tax=Fusobacterium nucleatum subsp. polymorphum TaxID=76857 RepID=A0A246EHE7_FUSNP|nr:MULTISPECIES: hypothetical protein [Fusobacterium]OWP26076.1 hypothetical protein CA839_09470 [Fusobacterium polymorphum]WCB32057.1 hypothetical protein PGW91_09015 [Fusobacterium nucleatum]WDF24854.1 hypothetical protein PSC67_12695 [Fusobacterium nucleatum]
MKEIEKIEASIYLYDCLKEVLPEYAVKFMKELKNKLEKSYKILDFSEDEIREFYSDSNVAPGIYLKFNETKIEDTDYYFTLKIEINTYEICLCFGFDSKKKGEELCFVKLEDMKNISKDFYDNLTKLENNLGQNDVESRNGKKAVDMSLENTDFRKVSTDNKFLINLLEDDTRKEEVERVYKEIEDIVKKAGLK